MAGCGDNGRDGLATGTFDAVELIVSNEVPGKIVRLDVSEGDAISDGQLIGLMDTVQLDLQMRALLKNIDAMYSQRTDIGRQLAPYRQRLSNEQNELNRLKRLVESDAATQKQLDDAVSAVEVARKPIEAQDNNLGK